MSDVLRAPHFLEYTYTRSVGPVVDRFFAGLGDHTFVGIKGSDGKVIVPPTEYDPRTGDSLSEFVDAGDESKMSTGMRVKVRWAADAVPDMAAIECFEPENATS